MNMSELVQIVLILVPTVASFIFVLGYTHFSTYILYSVMRIKNFLHNLSLVKSLFLSIDNHNFF